MATKTTTKTPLSIKYSSPLFKDIAKSLKNKKNRTFSVVLAVFVIIVLGVLGVASLKLLTSNTKEVYVKVKLAQGLWWASSQKPTIWFINSLKKGETEYSFLGEPTSEVLGVKYFPADSVRPEQYESDYNVYLTVKLSANYNEKLKEYTYNRSPLAIGTAVELNFPNVQVTGTVIDMSDQPIEDNYVTKKIKLTQKFAHPWEYDAIKVGDSYFNGEENTFEITAKHALNTYGIPTDPYGNVYLGRSDLRYYVTVEGNIKVREENGNYIYGEEQILKPGRILNLSTASFEFHGFTIESIE